MISEKRIRTALDARFSDAEPPLALWERVRAAVPAARPTRRHLSRLTVAAIWALALLTGSVAVASTPQVQALIDGMFKKTGIQLVEVTPEVRKEWESLPPSADGEPVVSSFVSIEPDKVRELAHPAFKLPSYLPPGVMERVQSLQKKSMSAFSFAGSSKVVIISMHTYAFGPGSRQGTDGPVKDVRDVMVGGNQASAYLDSTGWTVMWVMDGNQYIVQGIGCSLEETLKIAESMK